MRASLRFTRFDPEIAQLCCAPAGGSWSLDPSTTYRLNCQIIYGTAGSSSGLYVEGTDTVSTDSFKLLNVAQTSAVGITSVAITSFNSLMGTTISSAVSNYFANLNGYVRTDSTSGPRTFAIEVAGTGSANVQISAGSWCTVQ